MPTITITVDVSEETADKISGLPEEKRMQITANALQNAVLPHFASASVASRMTWEELVAAGTGQQAAAAQHDLFEEWKQQAAQTPDEEPDVETFMANMNANRRLTGEEAIY